MRAVLQRVRQARVLISGRVVGEIGPGLLALVCVGRDDNEHDVELLAQKTVHLRIFADDEGKMNRSLIDVGGGLLAVSQFTLYADCRKGRRPSFLEAAPPEMAVPLFERWKSLIREFDVELAEGEFGEMMDVELLNDGPVTIILDTKELA